MQDALQAELESVNNAIQKWLEIYTSVDAVLTKYVKLAKGKGSGIPANVVYTEAKVIGHTHLGPQAVWYGQNYAKLIIGTDDMITNLDHIVLPLVFKPGLMPDNNQQDAFVSMASPFGVPLVSYNVSARGKWVFYVVSPPKVSRYGVVQWHNIKLGKAEENEGNSNLGQLSINEVASWILDGVGMWIGPKELVTIANLYELAKLLKVAQNFPEMFRLDFGIKPGDIID
jgi:hypothetical protein